MDGARRPGVELAPIANVFFISRGGTIHAHVFEHYRDMIVAGLRAAGLLDAYAVRVKLFRCTKQQYLDKEHALWYCVPHAGGQSSARLGRMLTHTRST